MPAGRPRSIAAKPPRAGKRPSPLQVPPHEAEGFPVVGIGASAGGLEAFRNFLDVLPAGIGMAFILVQHLDPTHASLLVDLLTSPTRLAVRQAADGMPIERDHLYIIPPGHYLAVERGLLRLSQPEARYGARLPFNFLLNSLASELGARAICIVLSGTGADGSLGLKAVKDDGGLVIAQDPAEAGYDGMPRSAIATGAVDLVLRLAKIPEALVNFSRGKSMVPNKAPPSSRHASQDWLGQIIEMLRTKTAHDFTKYKAGTLRRRIERRMALAGLDIADGDAYLAKLRADHAELELLARDLLINVTSFFRDPKVFARLSEKIIPDLVAGHTLDHPIRIWIAGCSTGEETYSLAMLFREAIMASKRNVKLQVFASDVDPDAVAAARESLYPEAISADVSPERLARFFTKEDHDYRIVPELRSLVVFTVQDVLADPPFSRIDLVSCRNLLIYLLPEAQAQVIALFHFALREGGVLLLGSSETIGNPDGRFEVISKPERLYRHIGRGRPGNLHMSSNAAEPARAPWRGGTKQVSSRPAVLADLCRRLVMENYAPAAVLINRKNECVYSLGPADTYLKVPPGHPMQDLLAMAREGVRTKLRSAIQRAIQEERRILVTGGAVTRNGVPHAFSVAAQPVLHEGESLLLVCFIDAPLPARKRGGASIAADAPRIGELELELAATRTELQGAIRNLEISGEEQNAINEEALSVNEEFQSTNEELLTSKEELQSLNEELTALNNQLQETLERQRTTSNDLQNVLISTDVATLFLDKTLNIRFFTPATRLLFNVIPGDVGRPLADLKSLTTDGALLKDARTVLKSLAPLEREIEARTGNWYRRRILPYRSEDNKVEGVVITFNDITERRKVAEALAAAEREAQLANVAKSRFLAAASHDLRQPLQTLALIQGLLARKVEGEKAKMLVARLDETLGTMSGMLNTLLDINKIEAGTVRADMSSFPVGELLARLKGEFAFQAKAQKLDLRMVACSLTVHTDAGLLEQMIRNLLANALKYTHRGKVLLGCRRRGDMLSIEVWDTGIGIPPSEFASIFEEYRQLDNAARERNRGLGLGLSIVQRLAALLGHRVHVRSNPGTGSVFAIEIKLSPKQFTSMPRPPLSGQIVTAGNIKAGTILIVEDDPELSSLLHLMLKGEGHRTATAPHGAAALELVSRGDMNPDILLADYNLPGGMNGLKTAAKLRARLARQIPVVILTGDISARTLREVAAVNCVHLSKPVKPAELIQAIQRLLPPKRQVARTPAATANGVGTPAVFIVDDDPELRVALRSVFEDEGRIVMDFESCEAFLEGYRPDGEACLLIDAYLPGMDGLELLRRLREAGHKLPAIMITGNSDVAIAVEAMKAGASDFIEKPINHGELLARVDRALEQARDSSKLDAWRETSASQIAGLTPRQRQVMRLVVDGHPSKNIAADLGISQRTVENHRASIMRRTGSKSLPALARLALAADLARNGGQNFRRSLAALPKGVA